MIEVTPDNLDDLVERWASARGGATNEDTQSEAAFIATGKWCGVFTLHTGREIVWIGLQNASSRYSNGGPAFSSVRAAIERILACQHPDFSGVRVFLSFDSRERLLWMVDRITEHRKAGAPLSDERSDESSR